MPIQHAIWKVAKSPEPLREVALASEQQLEDMIVVRPAILSDDWMLIGRQEITAGTPLESIGEGKSFVVCPSNDCVAIVLENKTEKRLSPGKLKKCADLFNDTGPYITTCYQNVTALSSYILGVPRHAE